jgi:hypothetical protein
VVAEKRLNEPNPFGGKSLSRSGTEQSFYQRGNCVSLAFSAFNCFDADRETNAVKHGQAHDYVEMMEATNWNFPLEL